VLRELNGYFERAVNRGEVDAYLALCAPDIWFQSATARADGVSYEGHEGMRSYFRQLSEVFGDIGLETLEAERPEPNRVLTRNRWRARGRGSGAELDVPMRSEMVWAPGEGVKRLVATIDPDDDLSAA
jgi:ketosteroid isomerase-like protein